MDISNYLLKSVVKFNLNIKTREELFSLIGKTFFKAKIIKSSKLFIEDLEKREAQVSTALVDGVAIPHTQSDNVIKSTIGFFKLSKGIYWDDKKENLVDSIFVIAVPKKTQKEHLAIIGELSKNMLDDKHVARIRSIKTYGKLLEVLNKPKIEKSSKFDRIQVLLLQMKKTLNSGIPRSGKSKTGYDVVGVTCCTTGVAHTYMAAESISNVCKEQGLTAKIETQGTDRVLNELTIEDVQNAKVIILAIDRNIDMNRFQGKLVLRVSTQDVIKRGHDVIKRALKGEGKIIPITDGFKGDSTLSQLQSKETIRLSKDWWKNVGKVSYQSLLSGISYMIPFVVFGGIFLALSFLADINNSSNVHYGEVSTAARWFKGLGLIAFGLFIPVLSAYIAYNVVGKAGLLPGFMVGMISTGHFTNGDKIGFFNEPAAQSGYLGAILGGFMVIVIVSVIRKYLYKLPKPFHGVIGILALPLSTTLVAGVLMWLINIPLGLLNAEITNGLKSIASSGPVMIAMGILIGSMMAFDMGGPVNKSAYFFGVYTLSITPHSVQMAQVMMGGMLPPLIVAFSTTFFPKLWTNDERKAGYTAWILGCSFITEGAIPFAAKRPKVIIPSIVFGSAIGAMLLGVFSIGDGVTLAAPQGGIFVFALIQYGSSIEYGILAYLLCLVVGSISGALMILVMRKITKVPIVVDKEANFFVVNLFKKIRQIA